MDHTDLIRAGLLALSSTGEGFPPDAGRDARINLHAHGLYPIYRVVLADGTALAAKVEPPGVARAEVEGLHALGAAGALVPRTFPLHFHDNFCVLFMEFLDGRFSGNQGHTLSEMLGLLYQTRGPDWGWPSSNFIGTLPQTNALWSTFHEFWWLNRIQPQLQSALEQGLVDKPLANQIEAVTSRRATDWHLNAVGPRLVHGDLWSGNLHAARGGVYLIDPAVAYGHPEQDLAMLALFGHPMSPLDEDKVARAAGLAPGFRDRAPYFQIYPLLVHVNIFGASYVSKLASAVRRCS